MRRTVVRVAALAGLLLSVAAFGQQPGGTKLEVKDKKAEQKPAVVSLEDLIAQALRNNPDVRVAEAKVREAADPKAHWMMNLQNADEAATDLGIELLANTVAKAMAGPEASLAEKIRKALDTPIDASFKDKPCGDVLKEIEKKLEGVPVRE